MSRIGSCLIDCVSLSLSLSRVLTPTLCLFVSRFLRLSVCGTVSAYLSMCLSVCLCPPSLSHRTLISCSLSIFPVIFGASMLSLCWMCEDKMEFGDGEAGDDGGVMIACTSTHIHVYTDERSHTHIYTCTCTNTYT